MDKRVIRPIPPGFYHVPAGTVAWTTTLGVPVLDYMTSVKATDTRDAKVLEGEEDALMVSVYDSATSKMVYAKAPPVGFVFLHDFAGTAVDPNPAKQEETPLDKPLEPVVALPKE